ncbi:MAG: AAA family ATPase [Candidatus Nealsonbacteria bacterium]|nr:AAA family ATPase [Candidatus Nealsonbacteria bacterium]
MELILTAGLPGSGKTTIAKYISKKKGALLLRTDVIRRVIFNNPKPPYAQKDMGKVYEEMLRRTKTALASGKSVVLDATFAKKMHRNAAKKIAKKAGADFYIIEAVCKECIIKDRLLKRKGDASQALFKHYQIVKRGFQKITEPHSVFDTSFGNKKMPLFKIGLDLDGVIIDHSENKMMLAKKLGFSVKKEDVGSEKLKTLIPKEQYKALKKELYGKISLKAGPMPFSLESISGLKCWDTDLYIISKRKESKLALDWLKIHNIFSLIPENRVYFVKEEKEKAVLAKKLGIDIFLDDKSIVLSSMASIVPHLALFGCRKGKNHSGKWVCLKSWKEFLEFADKIKKSRYQLLNGSSCQTSVNFETVYPA